MKPIIILLFLTLKTKMRKLGFVTNCSGIGFSNQKFMKDSIDIFDPFLYQWSHRSILSEMKSADVTSVSKKKDGANKDNYKPINCSNYFRPNL